MKIEVKRDPFLFGFAAFLVLLVVALVWHKDVTFKEGAAFIMGALAMPALLGRAKGDDDDDLDGGVTVPVPGAERTTDPEQHRPRGIAQQVVALAFAAALLVGCREPAAPITPQQKATTAEATYAAEMQHCVDVAETLAESTACRAQVRTRWATDGGAR